MSVVAGVSLIDGVLIGADCRISYGEGHTKTYRDELQKLIPIGTHTAIRFVGNVSTAAKLLHSMLKARDGRREVEVERWLPRYFAYQFKKIKDAQQVDFLVGSVIPGRPNIVAKAAIAKAVFDAIYSRPAGGINTIYRSFLDILNMPTANVAVKGSGEGHLYAMKSPTFIPTHYSADARDRGRFWTEHARTDRPDRRPTPLRHPWRKPRRNVVRAITESLSESKR
jgi:hypothetical protein